LFFLVVEEGGVALAHHLPDDNENNCILVLRLPQVAGWLRQQPQAENQKQKNFNLLLKAGAGRFKRRTSKKLN
jgi:hypothetical protein